MIEEALNEAPNQVTVGATSIFPLTVYLYQYYVICFDQPLWATELGFLIRAIKLKPAGSHGLKQGFNTFMIVDIPLFGERIRGNVFNPEDIEADFVDGANFAECLFNLVEF